MKKTLVAFFLTLLLNALAWAAEPDARFFPLEEIRPGLKGYGMTVFQGSKPERFEVEILGLADGFNNPKQSIIIGRLSGALAERTFVFAGMSGSPVYVDGKLVGAIAYAFPFSKEPLAGIQPIQYMIDIFEHAGDHDTLPTQRLSFNTLMSQAAMQQKSAPLSWQISPRAATSSAMIPYIGQTIVPIATPVTFAGIPQAVIDLFAEDLKRMGIQPVAGVGSSAPMTPMVAYDDSTLTPGTTISAQLTRGDFTIDAAGTVTFRDGQRIYAFGHPFLTAGQTFWPMAEGSVITVVPNLNNSFKLTVPGNFVGAIRQDRSTGIYGRLGDQPPLIPLKVAIHTSRNKIETYNVELISDPFLTPLLTRMTLAAAIFATERQLGSQTLGIKGRIAVNGQPDIVLDNSFASPTGAAMFAANAAAQPISALLNSGFDPVEIRSIELDITSVDSRSSGELNKLWIDKTEARRGEQIEIQAFARNENGMEFVERIPFQIPADAPVGPLVIIVGDGASINQTELRAQAGADFVPKDLRELVAAINRLKKNNRLYLKVLRATAGAVVNSQEMPTLPPSVLATLGSERTSGGYTPLSVATVAEQELPPAKFLIIGQQSITINVVK